MFVGSSRTPRSRSRTRSTAAERVGSGHLGQHGNLLASAGCAEHFVITELSTPERPQRGDRAARGRRGRGTDSSSHATRSSGRGCSLAVRSSRPAGSSECVRGKGPSMWLTLGRPGRAPDRGGLSPQRRDVARPRPHAYVSIETKLRCQAEDPGKHPRQTRPRRVSEGVERRGAQ